MQIIYIMLLNISENFEGNVNFENSIRGYLMTRYILNVWDTCFIAFHYYYNYIFLMKLMPGSPFNDAKLSAEQRRFLMKSMV